MILDLYIDTARRKLVAGPANSSIVAMPVLSQGNTVRLRVRCLKPTANFPLSPPLYEVIQTAGKTLQLAIGTKAGNASTHYTEQYTWSGAGDAADPYFEADLPMNTAAISNWLGASARNTSYLEINLVENATPGTILSEQVTVEASVIKNDTLTVPEGLTPLSAEVAHATFVQIEHLGSIILVSEEDPTKKRRLYVNAAGEFRADELV